MHRNAKQFEPYTSLSMRSNLVAAIFTLTLAAGPLLADDFGSSEWKDEVAHGYLPYRKLKYEDFPIADGIPTPHLMHTEGFFHYSYKARWSQDGDSFTARISELTVRSGFDQNKSWKQSTFRETKALLDHEQGHLDISELHTNEFRKSRIPVGSGDTGVAALEDLKTKIREISDRCNQESREEQAKYDQETSHGANTASQQQWTAALRQRLDEAHVTYWDSPRRP